MRMAACSTCLPACATHHSATPAQQQRRIVPAQAVSSDNLQRQLINRGRMPMTVHIGCCAHFCTSMQAQRDCPQRVAGLWRCPSGEQPVAQHDPQLALTRSAANASCIWLRDVWSLWQLSMRRQAWNMLLAVDRSRWPLAIAGPMHCRCHRQQLAVELTSMPCNCLWHSQVLGLGKLACEASTLHRALAVAEFVLDLSESAGLGRAVDHTVNLQFGHDAALPWQGLLERPYTECTNWETVSVLLVLQPCSGSMQLDCQHWHRSCTASSAMYHAWHMPSCLQQGVAAADTV